MKILPRVWTLLSSILLTVSAHAVEKQVLRGHIPAGAANLQPVDRMSGSARMNLAIGLPLRNQEALTDLLRQIYDPASPNYRHFLSPAEFTAMFGPTEEDYRELIGFATANGLRVTVAHPNRVVLDVEGSVTDIERTFHVTMRVYQHPSEGRTFHAPDVEPSLDLTIPVLHISGLDDYWLPRPNHKLKPLNSVASATPNAGSGPSGSFRGFDFRAVYAPGTPLNGTGQTVGLLQFDGFYANDIGSYVIQAGLPTIPITVVPIDGGVSTPGSGNSEVALDIEMVNSMSPGLAHIYVYEAPNPSPWVDLLSRMANDNLSRQLSCSWGGGGPDATAEQIFQQMAAQGQSFFNASGDSDAFTSSIPFPSDSPNITQVGGTTLTTTGPVGGFVSETAWNWGVVQGKYVGTSGGVSTFYSIPTYQQGINMSTNLGSTTMRNVPDVALTGDNVYVVYNNGSTGIFGGTSCAAPLWAGFMALVNQQAALGANPPVGFLNPIVYGIGKTNANYSNIFHDTTTGNNFSSSSPTKYSAVPAYDLCTGWGTPNGTNMINSLTPLVLRPLLTNVGFTVTAEGCSPANGAIDPDETVTVSLALQNLGTANTTNLMVTLLATNGVTSPSAPQTYGTVVAGGAAVTRSFSFTASGNCGDTIIPTFQLQNNSSNAGVVSVTSSLGAAIVTTASGANPAAINIPASANSGPASIFPSTISISGIADPVTKVTVTLNGLTHSNPDDLDMLLVGPAGQKLLLMSDCGGGGNLNNVTLTFDDNADAPLPDSGQITSGTWQPSNYGSGDTFSSPAPAGPYDSTLSVFNNQDPNGDWSLYIQDDHNPGVGSLAQGWSLTITTTRHVCCGGVVIAANLAIGETVAPTALNVGSNLTFTLSVTNLGPGSATNAVVTDVLPVGISFVSASTTQGSASNNAGSITCALGAMANGAVATITINATAVTAGTRTNSASAGSSTTDPLSADNTAAATFSVNSFPTISTITSRTINEDTTTGAITFTIGDAETAASSLTLSRSSSDTNLIPAQNIVLSGSGSNRTVTVTPATNASGSATITLTVSDGVASAASAFVLTVMPVNDPPVLAAIPNRTIFELSVLTFTNTASDVETNALTFSLGSGAPTNATINPTTGVFAWTPTETQGPGTNQISVIVTDNGTPNLSATQTFTVIVLETNSPPVLAPISDVVVVEGSLVTFTNTATDADIPANTLTYSLASAPGNAVLNSSSGVFSWQTSEADGQGTNVIIIVVTDNGLPSMSATQSFTVVVLETNTAPTLSPIADRAIVAGSMLVVTNVATDSDLPTNTLTFSLIAGPSNAVINASSGVLNWQSTVDDAASTNLFSVVVADDGAPSLTATQNFMVIVQAANTAPVLAPIPDRTIHASSLITFTNSAADADLPTNSVTFSLLDGAPAGAAVGATSGVFTWQTADSDANSTNSITIVAIDNGSPPLSDQKTFVVTVLSRPVIGSISVTNGNVSVLWNSIAGLDYQLQKSDDPTGTNWADVGATITATGSEASTSEAQNAAASFYRVLVLP